MTETIWLTWHDHPRSRGLASLVGAELRVYDRRKTGALRHWEGLWWTVWQLAVARPRHIYVQNGFVLLLVCALYRRLAGKRVRALVADCHNKSLKRRLEGRLAPVFWWLKTFSFRSVDLVIVSNDLLVPLARRLCGSVVTLIDPPPRLPDPGRRPTWLPDDRPYVLFVCSHEPDEPVSLIAAVIRELHGVERCSFVLTGNPPPGSPVQGLEDLEHVYVPGFVPWPEYCSLMHRAAVVVVLTEDDDCLCCGAYEAVTCRRRLVLPDHRLLRDVFGGRATYCRLDVEQLAARISDLLGRRNWDVRAAGDDEIRDRFESEFRELRKRLELILVPESVTA